MKTNIIKNFGLAISATLILGLVSCAGSSASGFSAMIPEDAIMVAYLDNPLGFIQSANDFSKASGLNGMLQNKSVDDFAAEQVNFDLAKFKELFDLSKPSGIILLGESIEKAEPSILLAVKKAAEAKTWLETTIGASRGMAIDGPFGSYLVLRQTSKEARTWPPVKPLKTALAPSAGKNHVIVAFNYASLMQSDLMNEAFTEMYGDNSDFTALIKDTLDAMEWFSLTLGVDNKALAMTMDLSYNKDSTYAKLLAESMKYGKASMAKDLVIEEFMGFATNAELKSSKIYTDYITGMLEALKITEAKRIITSLEKLLGAMGSDSLVSFDMDIAKGIQSMGPEALDNLGLKLAIKSKVKDAKVVSTELDSMLGMLTEILNPLLSQALTSQAEANAWNFEDMMGEGYYDDETGEWVGEEFDWDAEPEPVEPVDFKLGFTLNKDQAEDGITFDTYALGYSVSGGNDYTNNTLETTFTSITKVLGDIKILYKNGVMNLAGGSKSTETLKNLSEGKALGTPISKAANYADLSSYINTNGSLFGHISLARMVNKIGGAAGVPFVFEENVPGILMSADFSKSGMSYKMALGTKEIQTYVMQVAPFLGMLFK